MLFLHFNSFRLKYLFALILIFPLFACSGTGTEASNPFAIGSTSHNVLAINWVAPSEREDGTGLALSEIAGYRIYYGTVPGVYQSQIDINDQTVDQAQIVDIPLGTYYVVMTTIDAEGRESGYSSELAVTV